MKKGREGGTRKERRREKENKRKNRWITKEKKKNFVSTDVNNTFT